MFSLFFSCSSLLVCSTPLSFLKTANEIKEWKSKFVLFFSSLLTHPRLDVDHSMKKINTSFESERKKNFFLLPTGETGVGDKDLASLATRDHVVGAPGGRSVNWEIFGGATFFFLFPRLPPPPSLSLVLSSQNSINYSLPKINLFFHSYYLIWTQILVFKPQG